MGCTALDERGVLRTAKACLPVQTSTPTHRSVEFLAMTERLLLSMLWVPFLWVADLDGVRTSLEVSLCWPRRTVLLKAGVVSGVDVCMVFSSALSSHECLLLMSAGGECPMDHLQ